jgi:hypothetical protein
MPFFNITNCVYQTCTASASTTSITNCVLVSSVYTAASIYQTPICTASAAAATWLVQNTEVVIDEEDLVNHAEYFELARQRGITFRIRTAEERRLAAEAAEQARVEQERRAQARREAEGRARDLLISHLTADQRETFERNNLFVVEGGRSGRRYRIRAGASLVTANVDVMRGEAVEGRLCCHCRADIPAYDHYLAQKIALMWDEDNFLRTANRHAA